jgi:hypothetical protein
VPPHGRTRTDGQPRDQTTGLCRDLAAPCHNDKNKQQAQVVSIPRETEGKEKGRGSLSIFIVPIEIREIRTAESRGVGKGDAGS